jgi:hypothetical protein
MAATESPEGYCESRATTDHALAQTLFATWLAELAAFQENDNRATGPPYRVMARFRFATRSHLVQLSYWVAS